MRTVHAVRQHHDLLRPDRLQTLQRTRSLSSDHVYSSAYTGVRELQFIFTARCYASAVLAMGLCPSVCVCLSQAGVLLKRQNVGSHKQHKRYPMDSSFLMQKISAKFDRGHPLRGRRMQVGCVKISDFWPITGYISKTVQDRHRLPIKVE